jgi:putative transposase
VIDVSESGYYARRTAAWTAREFVYVLRTGAQWNAIPKEMCRSSVAHARFQEWEQAGFFRERWKAGLMEYNEVLSMDWEWQSVDGAMTKSRFGGAATGGNPTDRGKVGVKRSLIDRRRRNPAGPVR